jgi:uncharacterized protein YutD
MRTIEQINHEVFYDMEKFSQLTTDMVEKVEEVLSTEDYIRGDLGYIRYEINNVLEVINPKREDDIRILHELKNLIEDE